MNRLGGVMAVIGLVGVAACSGGDEPAAEPAEVVDETLPTLPPIATEATTTVATTEPPPTSESPATPTTVFDATARPGPFDWGVACQVQVTQDISGGPLIERDFTMVVTSDEEGYVIDFEDIEVNRRMLSEEEAATLLFSRGVLLPSMRLDHDGRLVEFLDLDEVVAETLDLMGVEPGSLDLDAYASVVRLSTSSTWFGFWLDTDEFQEEMPEESIVMERIVGLPMPSTVRLEGVRYEAEVTEGPWRGAAMGLSHWEFGELSLGVSEGEPLPPEALKTLELLVGSDYFNADPPDPNAEPSPPSEDFLRVRLLGNVGLQAEGRRPVRAGLDFGVSLATGPRGLTSPIEDFGIVSDFEWDGATSIEPGGCNLS